MSNQGSAMESNYLQRVKVYRLNDDGKWDDKGTGHVSVEYLERSDAVGLVVIDEDDHATLLVHRISADDIYQRQEDTIISWTDPEVATDLALSFQETMGCAYIWEQICTVQRQSQFPNVASLDAGPRQLADDLEHSGTSQDDDDALPDGGNRDIMDLPPVDLKNLYQIVKSVTDIAPYHRDRVASMLLRDRNYVGRILEQFRVCEDLENIEGLHHLYKIVKGLILLNDGRLFDLLFSDEVIMDVVGALEYDPELAERQNHRAYLKEQVVFKEAVPIRDPAVLSKIHQTYRIGYIKDVILPRVLDDQTSGTFNSLMLFNSLEVVTSLHIDRPFMTDLFSRLMNSDPSKPSWRDLVSFLQEFCNLHKHLPPAQRNQLFSDLIAAGLFEIVTTTMQHPDEAIRLSGADILMATLNPDPAALRGFLVDQADHLLYGLLVKGMLTIGEGGLQVQLLEILRLLLDPDTMEGVRLPCVSLPVDMEKNKFLEVFYDQYVDKLVGALTGGRPFDQSAPQKSAVDSPDHDGSPREISPEVMANIVELLCFCVQHHSFRIKYYVLRNNVVEKVLRLLRRREKYLVVAAVRFLRICIGSKDDFYYRYLLKNNLFEPVIQAFLTNGNRYNLLNSAVIEMIDFIRKENIKSLISHLVEKFGEKLASVTYVDTFNQLQLKYDQAKENSPMSDSPAAVTGATIGPKEAGPNRARERLTAVGPSAQRRRKDDRELDKDEENYFNEDSDEEADTASAPAQSSPKQKAASPVVINGASSLLQDLPLRKIPFGLVDYEDEEEDAPTERGSNGLHSSQDEVRQDAGVQTNAEGCASSKRYVSNTDDPSDDTESPGKKRRIESPLYQESGERQGVQAVSEPTGRSKGGAVDRSVSGRGVEPPEWFDREFENRTGQASWGTGSQHNHNSKGSERKSMGSSKNKPSGGMVRPSMSIIDSDHGSRREVGEREEGEERHRSSREGAEGGAATPSRLSEDDACLGLNAALEVSRGKVAFPSRQEGSSAAMGGVARIQDTRQSNEVSSEAGEQVSDLTGNFHSSTSVLHGESEPRLQGQKSGDMVREGFVEQASGKFGHGTEGTDLGTHGGGEAAIGGIGSDVLRTGSSPEPFPVR